MAARRWRLAVRLAAGALVWSAGLVLAGLLILPVAILLAAAVRVTPGPAPDGGPTGDMSAAPAGGG